ncbi:MAG: hypothetical protein HYZ81_22985, partial [Nitrospinae bacterium]|nr:hypothetical protein [Nitrospinota bacterium]
MNDQHTTAQELSARAATFLAERHAQEAQHLFAEAAKHEAAALASVPSDKTRSRSVLSVSVASLLYKGARLDEAEKAIFGFLAPGDLDAWADTQLRELLHVVTDERLLMTTLARRYPGESITVSLRGGEIGAGTGPLDLILDKATGFRSLLYRMAEWVGRFPLRHHGPPPKELLDIVQARATEPAAGSYSLEIRLTEPVQPDLYKPTRVTPVELSDRLFNFLQCLTAGTPNDLENLVPEPDYRKALLQLTRNFVPGGKRIREIGIYRQKQGRLESIYLTNALPPRIREAIPRRPESLAEEHRSYRGVLRALHLDRNWLTLTLE